MAMSIRRVLSVIALVPAAVSLATAAHAGCSDPALADTVRHQIATVCNCDAFPNHGQYVRCVADQVNTAVSNGLPTNCKGAVKRCAARSTCGKKTGFVTCCFASPGVCRDGFCQDRSACIDASTCPIVTKCRTKSSDVLCLAAGGSPGSGSCCDAVCSVPAAP